MAVILQLLIKRRSWWCFAVFQTINEMTFFQWLYYYLAAVSVFVGFLAGVNRI